MNDAPKELACSECDQKIENGAVCESCLSAAEAEAEQKGDTLEWLVGLIQDVERGITTWDELLQAAVDTQRGDFVPGS